jgi:Colicin V production protein
VLYNLIRDSGLSGIDRSLGFGFGIARGIMLLTIIEMGMGFFVSRAQQPPAIKESKLIPLVYQGSDFTLTMLPMNLRQFICEKQKVHHENDLVSAKSETPILQGDMKADVETSEMQAEGLANLKPQSIDDQVSSTVQTAKTVVDTKNSIDRLLEMGKEIEETVAAKPQLNTQPAQAPKQPHKKPAQ